MDLLGFESVPDECGVLRARNFNKFVFIVFPAYAKLQQNEFSVVCYMPEGSTWSLSYCVLRARSFNTVALVLPFYVPEASCFTYPKLQQGDFSAVSYVPEASTRSLS